MEFNVSYEMLKKCLIKTPFAKHRKEIYLWYTESTKETGINLAKCLKINSGKTLPDKNKYKFIICWGTSELKEKINLKNFKFINNYYVIQNNRNKFKSLEIMDKKGVMIPRFYKIDVVLEKIRKKEISFPLIARKNRHQGGSGLIMCLCASDIKRAIKNKYDYFVEYIPNDVELRVHIFGEKVIRISKKERNYDGERWIKNRERGWYFKDISIDTVKEWDKTIIQECKNAVQSMHMQFGAVDVIYSDFNIPYVIEINSAPALNGKGLEIYSNEIKEYFNKNFKEEKNGNSKT